MSSEHQGWWLGHWDATQEWDGVWWLPGSKTELGGQFRLADFQLRVLGDQLVGAGFVQLIYGLCSGVPIVLVGCAHLSVDDVGVEVHSQTIAVDYAVVGEHLEASQFRFSGVQFRHPALEAWAARYPYERITGVESGYRRLRHEPRVATVGDATVALDQSSTGSLDRTYSLRAEAHEHLEVTLPEPASLGTVIQQWVRPLEQFVNLCSGYLGEHSHLRVTGSGDRWLDVHLRPVTSGETVQPRSRQIPLPLAVLEFEKTVPRWFTVTAQFDALCGAVLSPATWQLAPYPRFMAIAAVAETAAGKFLPLSATDRETHRARVDNIVSLVNSEDGKWLTARLADPRRSFQASLEALKSGFDHRYWWYLEHHLGKDWPRRCKVARVAYAHGLSDQSAVDDVFLNVMSEGLSLLLQVYLLRELELSEEEILVAMRRHPLHHRLKYLTIESVTDV